MYGINSGEIDGAIISSVVPSVTSVVKDSIETLFGTQVMVVGPGIKTGISIVIDNPAQLGSDLVVDAVAGVSEYSVPQIIIDMGTATTISATDSAGNLRGGAIAPGVGISLTALANSASLLQGISLENPKNVVGTNTVDSMKSGMVYGWASMLDGMIERINEELSFENPTVVATGGYCKYVVGYCEQEIEYDKNLVLDGLMEIYKMNK